MDCIDLPGLALLDSIYYCQIYLLSLSFGSIKFVTIRFKYVVGMSLICKRGLYMLGMVVIVVTVLVYA